MLKAKFTNFELKSQAAETLERLFGSLFERSEPARVNVYTFGGLHCFDAYLWFRCLSLTSYITLQSIQWLLWSF